MPIVTADVMVVCIDADVHEDAKDDEDDDGEYFEERQPVLYCKGQ